MKIFRTLFFVTVIFITAVNISFGQNSTLKINFEHYANGKKIVLSDSSYNNIFGEQYFIKKLRYYVSNLKVNGQAFTEDSLNYHLIDLAKSTSIKLPLTAGKYNKLVFMLGVDSSRNCSGIQQGALDPAKDMFWTWNTGYVVFKLEGTSSSSNADRNRIEHHVGGYRFGNNISQFITFNIGEVVLKPDSISEITINVNLDRYWDAVNTIRISEDPICTLPGTLAKKIAANFPAMFTVKHE